MPRHIGRRTAAEPDVRWLQITLVRLLLSVTAILAGACEQKSLDGAIVGEYRLISRNGQTLPASTAYPGQSCTIELLAARLEMRSNGKWSETVTSRERCGDEEGPLGTFERSEGGIASFLDNTQESLLLSSEELDREGLRQVATLQGQELHLELRSPQTEADHVFVYERIQK